MWFAILAFAVMVPTFAPFLAETPLPAQARTEAPPEVRSYSLRAGDLMGKPVRNPQGERLGTIDDVVISGEDRTPFVVVALGDASGETWEAAKRSFEQSWQDFQREWSRSTK